MTCRRANTASNLGANPRAIARAIDRELAESPEPPEIQARQAFDELVGVGGVPMRSWADCRQEDLTESQ
jgi:hypothetical protein